MKLFSSMMIAFSMYSKIPMPQVKWDEERMKYSLCFFPLVGVFTGGGTLLVWWLSGLIPMGEILKTVLLTLTPLLITGGIHLDGYCDTIDALRSYQPTPRKLEILKDPNSGAFAVIYCSVYLFIFGGLMSEMKTLSMILAVSVGFVLSRALSGLAIVTFKGAKKSGSLYAFSSAAHKRATLVVMLLFIAASLGAIACLNLWAGLFTLLICGGIFLYYRVMSYRQFGGITGDLAGYFLSLAEIGVPAAVFLASLIH